MSIYHDPAWGGEKPAYMVMEELRARIAELEAENARLREVAREQHAWEEMAERLGMSMKPKGAEPEIATMKRLAELYPLAWEECKSKRGSLTSINVAADAHDKARAERGVVQ